ncbi:MAG: sporulation peptidase YabG [Eubacteriales bacterium]|nr:sporulation peptidase YabG [Eubacteriales bacterium]MDD3072823.1 sporulation peptidase YabG [Eubacteriales bacterium]MDD4078250.1 sporulation peptidase YabG [Eubacteriales bacterium]MDD4768969.1 sporulation peptidase YabG [Eubacteriales bacterium]
MEIVKGDIVLRLSHGKDIYFKVESIDKKTQMAMLRGVDIRLCADAPLSDLVKPGIGEIANYRAKSFKLRIEIVSRASRQARFIGKEKKRPDYVEIPGKVLHLDGDADYMEICRKAYNELQIANTSLFVPEIHQPGQVEIFLRKYNPDILVLTGHDGMIKSDSGADGLDKYHNVRYFIEAVQIARSYQPSKDDLVIFAGACQSWYQGLLAAGANYASSPDRVLIHCLDPVMVVQKVAYTPVTRTANIQETLEQSVTGPAGIGGIETRGQFRLGLPKV